VADQKMKNEPNFSHLMPIHNLNKNNKLQQKINNGHLAKTNPILPASRGQNQFPILQKIPGPKAKSCYNGTVR
jgi:hypothetical protein